MQHGIAIESRVMRHLEGEHVSAINHGGVLKYVEWNLQLACSMQTEIVGLFSFKLSDDAEDKPET